MLSQPPMNIRLIKIVIDHMLDQAHALPHLLKINSHIPPSIPYIDETELIQRQPLVPVNVQIPEHPFEVPFPNMGEHLGYPEGKFLEPDALAFREVEILECLEFCEEALMEFFLDLLKSGEKVEFIVLLSEEMKK